MKISLLLLLVVIAVTDEPGLSNSWSPILWTAIGWGIWQGQTANPAPEWFQEAMAAAFFGWLWRDRPVKIHALWERFKAWWGTKRALGRLKRAIQRNGKSTS